MSANPAPILPVYAPPEQVFVKGEGCWLIAKDGRRYLDFIAGIAVNALGHAHPKLVKALQDQSEKLWHLSNMFRVEGQEELARRYVETSFADFVFFTNSGTEAIEGALKTARKYHTANGNPERVDIIGFQGSFHGRSYAAINASGNPSYLEGFGPRLPGYIQVPFADHEALKAAIGPTTAAVILEPVQGEGGVRAVPEQCLKGLRDLCDAHGLLLIFDEVQCGIGRTGKLFAHEWAGVAPDIMAIAKGIGGGFPLGACLATERAASGMTAGTHGSTFGGNPLATAVGNAVLDVVLAAGFLEQVDRVARHLWRGMLALAERHPRVILGVQGAGLLLGLRLTPEVNNGVMQGECVNQGLLTVAAGMNVLRVAPPLIITETEVDEALAAMDRACLALTPAEALAPAK